MLLAALVALSLLALSHTQTITITSPTNEDFVSGRIGVEIFYEISQPASNSSPRSKVALYVGDTRAGDQPIPTNANANGVVSGSFTIAPFSTSTLARLTLRLQLINDDDDGEAGNDDGTKSQATVRPRIAVDTYVESEQGSYALWMPPWLAAGFEHLFEIDESGRQTMPPLEAYLTLQDLVVTLPKDAVLLDVGAHIGQSALPVAAAGYDVVSVEPVHSSALLLKHNARMSGFGDRVQVIEAVASDTPGEHTLYIPEMQDNACLSHAGAVANMQSKKAKELVVPRVVLDDWLDAHPEIKRRVRFVKIDTQGFELYVLRGLVRFFKSAPSPLSVLTEWDDKLMKHAGVDPKDVEREMERAGFKLVEDGGDRLYVK